MSPTIAKTGKKQVFLIKDHISLIEIKSLHLGFTKLKNKHEKLQNMKAK